jgi:HNH endonuclease
LSRSSIPRALRSGVFERDAGRCRYCGLSQLGHGATFHIDHILPRSRGGATALDNLALQCPSCSLHKADKVTATDPETGRSVELFHPLRQPWQEHFRLEPDGVCGGLTAVGRATVVALGMNALIPRFARVCQMALGLLASSP